MTRPRLLPTFVLLFLLPFGAQAQQIEQTDDGIVATVNRTFAVDPGGTLDLRARNGDIIVAGGDRSEVVVEETIRFDDASREDVTQYLDESPTRYGGSAAGPTPCTATVHSSPPPVLWRRRPSWIRVLDEYGRREDVAIATKAALDGGLSEDAKAETDRILDETIEATPRPDFPAPPLRRRPNGGSHNKDGARAPTGTGPCGGAGIPRAGISGRTAPRPLRHHAGREAPPRLRM